MEQYLAGIVVGKLYYMYTTTDVNDELILIYFIRPAALLERVHRLTSRIKMVHRLHIYDPDSPGTHPKTNLAVELILKISLIHGLTLPIVVDYYSIGVSIFSQFLKGDQKQCPIRKNANTVGNRQPARPM